jgi:hypothetical protein
MKKVLFAAIAVMAFGVSNAQEMVTVAQILLEMLTVVTLEVDFTLVVW